MLKEGIFFCVLVILFSQNICAQYSDSGESWQIDKSDTLPLQEVNLLYQRILQFCDSLDENFFTLSEPYNQYIFLFKGSEKKQDMAVFQTTIYKEDSSQSFVWVSQTPFSQDEHFSQTKQLTTSVYDEYYDELYNSRHRKRLALGKQLKTGKWYQRPMGDMNDPLTYRDSIAFLIKRVNGKVNILVVSIGTGKEFLYSTYEKRFPDFNLKKWNALF